MTTRRGFLSLAAVVPALAACSSGTGVSSEDGFAVGDGSYTRIAPDKRAAAPELAGTTLDGKKISTADYVGKVVVINVWGSWCAPCRHEAPQLVKAAAETKGVAQFIGLNTRDTNQAAAASFARVSKMTYPHIWDPDGKLLLAFRSLPAKAIPSTLVLDKQGRIAARILGETRATTLVGTVQDIAAGK